MTRVRFSVAGGGISEGTGGASGRTGWGKVSGFTEVASGSGYVVQDYRATEIRMLQRSNL